MRGISCREWLGFILLAFAACLVWYRFSYPQFSILNIAVNKKDAGIIATKFLSSSHSIDTSKYLKAVTLKGDFWADIYLQRVLGFKGEEAFINQHQYEFLYWFVRFFEEGEKEEYRVLVSPSSGEVVGYIHLIEDTEERKTLDKESVRAMAEDFLKNLYRIDFNDYVIHKEALKKFDKRIDYEFSWEKKDIYIPWKDEPNSGGAKLLVKTTVSGDEVREFYKARLDIPERFNRFVEKNIYFGEGLASFSFLVVFFWLVVAAIILFKRKDAPCILGTFKFYIYIGAFLLVFNILEQFNNINNVLSAYPTSSSLTTFVGLYFISVTTSAIFMSLSFLLPGTSAEYLRYEVFPDRERCSFFHYVRTTIFSRGVTKSIVLGYLLCIILLAIQSVCIYFGNRYLGLWVEKIQLIKVSSSFVPFYSALLIGLQAAFSEEIIFRLFGINWAKRYFKNTVFAILLTSLIWGFGHADYPVFPVWFRGIEVTILGLIYGAAYLRFGLIPLIVAHYLFDVYWGTASYIFGGSTAYLFWGSMFVAFIPLIFASICYILNREEKEKSLEAALTPQQIYNSEILIYFIDKRLKEGARVRELEDELIRYGWEATLVRYVAEKFK